MEIHSDLLVRGCLSRRRKIYHKEHKEMKGGNEVSEANVVTLRRATGVNPWVYCRLQMDKPGSRLSQPPKK